MSDWVYMSVTFKKYIFNYRSLKGALVCAALFAINFITIWSDRDVTCSDGRGLASEPIVYAIDLIDSRDTQSVLFLLRQLPSWTLALEFLWLWEICRPLGVCWPPTSWRRERRISSCVDYIHWVVAETLRSSRSYQVMKAGSCSRLLTPFKLAVSSNKRLSYQWVLQPNPLRMN